ncbi:hypothetical protein BD289DRAFT_441093 [Coniella lustricola]|uniref:CFEM domain-containing protein n=1 Tax=Coniella lustricola TaxID=2025994 RepID=A0A2T2ZZU9_9PEZI|nr:hypothetical protein BD289DRAFT_441093 [Coniella lustricola]
MKICFGTTALLGCCLATLIVAQEASSSSSSSSISSPSKTPSSDPTSRSMPFCGEQCLFDSRNVSQCAPTNRTCLCEDVAYSNAVSACVHQSCSVKESLLVRNATQTACGVEPRNVSRSLVIISITLATLTLLVNIMRLAFRHFVSTSGLQGDDWAIVPPLVVGLFVNVVIVVKAIPNGLGQDIWRLTPGQITRFAMWFYIIELSYFFDMACLKLSILIFYMRVFDFTDIRGLLQATAIFTCLYGVAFVLAGMFQCWPISYFWTKWDGEHAGKCFDVNALGWANAAISIATDFWMLALPLSQLRALRLPWRKKVGVSLMFMVGIVITIFSIIRLKALVRYVNSPNVTFDNFGVFVWSTLEVNIGMICACMPVMRQMLAWLLPSVFDGSKQHSRQYYFRLSKQRGRGTNMVLHSALDADEARGNFRTKVSSRHCSGRQSSARQPSTPSSRIEKEDTPPPVPEKDWAVASASHDDSSSSSCVKVDRGGWEGEFDDVDIEAGESMYLPPREVRMRFGSFDADEESKNTGKEGRQV